MKTYNRFNMTNTILKSAFIVASLFQVGFSASLQGLGALGEDLNSGDAAITGRGYAGSALEKEGFSALNPARMVFDDLTRFTISMDYQGVYSTANSLGIGRDQFGLGGFGLSIPFSGYGALGFGYTSKYAEDIYLVSKTDSIENASLQLTGSLFELSPAIAFRFPAALRFLSIGATFNIPMGRSTYIHKVRIDTTDLDSTTENLLNEVVIEDRKTSNWELDQVGYPTFSAQIHTKKALFFASASTPYTMTRTWESSQRLSSADTTAFAVSEESYEFPWSLSTGLSLELLQGQWFSAEFSQKSWSQSTLPGLDWAGLPSSYKVNDLQRTFALGWQKDGSGLFFDPILQRSTLRAGMWYKDWYLEGINEIALSLGYGIPLGKRGAELDLAVYGGNRGISGSQSEGETFWGLKLGLSGIGSWGSSSRRRN